MLSQSMTNPGKGVKITYTQLEAQAAPFAKWQQLIDQKIQSGVATIDVALLENYPKIVALL